MKPYSALYKINQLLAGSGIEVNGNNSWDIKVKYKFLVKFYYRILRYGSKGLGDAYQDGWWTCDKLDEFFVKILSAGLDKKYKPWRMAIPYIKATIFNLQTRKGSQKVAKKHYDLSAEMYESFLDPYNQYTCGLFEKGAHNLEEAQIHKMELMCQKLHLTKEDHLLDIGCGWGGFSKYAATHYGCKVTGITISKEQAVYARKLTDNLPVEILEMDYRDLLQKKFAEKFSKIVVCGMVEHVGYRNYNKFMKIVYHCLAPKGIFLLHTIMGLKSTKHTEPWIEENIFPNSMLPSLKQVLKASEGLFKLNDLHNFGFDYDPTLMAWYQNFVRNWKGVESDYYNDRFFRTMEYYFLSCAAAARLGINQLYQMIFTKDSMERYIPVR